MSTKIEHLINSRVLNTYAPAEEELKFVKDKNYLFDLSYLNVLEINGEKAIEFLQGQLTCDLRSVSDIQIAQGAQCNLKGRILSLVDIINWEGVKLVLPDDLIELTKNSLIKTAMLSRVSLIESKQYKVMGLYLQNSKDLLPSSTFFPTALYAQAYSGNYCYYHLGHGFYIFIIKQEHAGDFCRPFVEKKQLLGSLTWHTLRLKQHQVEIYPESRGLFLPHRLNLHETAYISFDKGCYKGQEIIARTHYRATLKHELRIYEIKSGQKIFSGQKLFKNKDGAEVGELIDYSILGNNNYLIAVSMLKEAAQSVFLEGHQEQVEFEL